VPGAPTGAIAGGAARKDCLGTTGAGVGRDAAKIGVSGDAGAADCADSIVGGISTKVLPTAIGATSVAARAERRTGANDGGSVSVTPQSSQTLANYQRLPPPISGK